MLFTGVSPAKYASGRGEPSTVRLSEGGGATGVAWPRGVEATEAGRSGDAMARCGGTAARGDANADSPKLALLTLLTPLPLPVPLPLVLGRPQEIVERALVGVCAGVGGGHARYVSDVSVAVCVESTLLGGATGSGGASGGRGALAEARFS